MDKAQVLEMLRDGRTHRKQFSANSGVQKQKGSPTFSVPFDNGLCSHFTLGTGRPLKYNVNYDQFYCFLRSQQDIEEVEGWERQKGTLVFIRNLLNSTTALDINFLDNESGKKTSFGIFEEAAKYSQDNVAIERLAAGSCDAISQIAHLNKATHICAIPAMAEKGFDLPQIIAAKIGAKSGKVDLTSNFNLTEKAKSAKTCSLEEKWDTWENAKLSYEGHKLDGQSILVIDDKYQSGLTMHFLASRLLKLGAAEVHGLAMVKTLRDTDNLDVIEH